MEVRNRFKGLDLIDRVPDLWTEVHDAVHDAGDRNQELPQFKKKCKKAKWFSEKALRRAEKLKAKEKRKDIPILMQSSKE